MVKAEQPSDAVSVVVIVYTHHTLSVLRQTCLCVVCLLISKKLLAFHLVEFSLHILSWAFVLKVGRYSII